MTIAEWIGTAVMLAVPYPAVGVLWADCTPRPGDVRAIVCGWWMLASTVCLA